MNNALENKKAIIDLGKDLTYNKVTKFSTDEANEVFRKALCDLIGMEDGKYNYKKFRRNAVAVFEIIEEVLDMRLEEGLKDQFERFVDYRSIPLGDKIQFRIPNRDLFRVSKIAGGTNNLLRQRLGEGQTFQIETNWEGVKIYGELEQFLAGRIDWAEMINRVQRSFELRIQELIYSTIKDAYSGVTAPFAHTGSWDLDEFNLIVEHLRAATGMEPIVIGTRIAVSKAIPNTNYISDNMKDARNRTGFFETVDGIQFGIIPQAHKVGTYDFMIDNDFLLILPNGNEKMIKFVSEGETLIKEVGANQQNADDSIEYEIRKKFGAAAVSGDVYGVYIFS